MKYDDASWHYGGDFPADLPQAAGATHIVMVIHHQVHAHGFSERPAQGVDAQGLHVLARAQRRFIATWQPEACIAPAEPF